MGVIGGLQHLLTLGLNVRVLALVDSGRGQQPQTSVVVLMVISVKEVARPGPLEAFLKTEGT